jgi:hypothetical protein
LSSPTISPDDRLPTFAEIENFDAGAAWDNLTPDQQRAVGMLAVRAGTVGLIEGYFHETFEDAAPHCDAKWTPDMIQQMVWPRQHLHAAAVLAHDAHQAFCDQFDALWPALFRWRQRTAVPR